MKDLSKKHSYLGQKPQAALPHLFFLTRELPANRVSGGESPGRQQVPGAWGSGTCWVALPLPAAGSWLAQAGTAFAVFQHRSRS